MYYRPPTLRAFFVTPAEEYERLGTMQTKADPFINIKEPLISEQDYIEVLEAKRAFLIRTVAKYQVENMLCNRPNGNRITLDRATKALEHIHNELKRLHEI